MSAVKKVNSYTKQIAQTGLIAKGIVYCLLGLLAFMAAFHINGQSADNTDKAGVFDFVLKQTGGQIVLGIIAAGLLCYTLWRFIQAFADKDHKGSDAKGIATRARYLFSGLVYGYLAVNAGKLLLDKSSGSGDNKQNLTQELLTKPFGQWLVGIVAAILLGVGVYQIYYGLSEKYRKHTQKAGHSTGKEILLSAGKIGYTARGVVWILLAWLFLKAALNANSSEAGDTSKALAFLSEATYGSYLLAAVGMGLICYGTFNFVRARYEKFN